MLTLLLANILEKGDGTDPNRAGYFRFRGPLFYELRGTDADQTLYCSKAITRSLRTTCERSTSCWSSISPRGSNPSGTLEPRRSSGGHLLFPHRGGVTNQFVCIQLQCGSQTCILQQFTAKTRVKRAFGKHDGIAFVLGIFYQRFFYVTVCFFSAAYLSSSVGLKKQMNNFF